MEHSEIGIVFLLHPEFTYILFNIVAHIYLGAHKIDIIMKHEKHEEKTLLSRRID